MYPRPISLRHASAMLTVLLLVGFVAPSHSDKGRWTAPVTWGTESDVVIHLALLRGDGALDHSRVVFWQSNKPGLFSGLELGWSPGNDDCTLAPGTGFSVRGRPLAPQNMEDVFCSGHTQLAGAGNRGQLLVIGGQLLSAYSSEFGERRCAIFTAGPGNAVGAWTETGTMTDPRWYPSAVALIDGRSLALAGDRYTHLLAFGGKRNGVLPDPSNAEGDRVLRFGPQEPNGRWDASVVPAADAAGLPPHRWRHSVAEMGSVGGFGGPVFFGGLSPTDTLNDAWLLTRSNGPVQDGDYQYQWTKILPTTRPDRRSDHSAVVRDNEMILFGGRDVSGNGLNDVWRLRKVGANFRWDPMTIDGSIPARYGHAAVYDASTIGGTLVKRMLVFGGIAADGQAPSDTTVYELRFDPSNPNHATLIPHIPDDLGGGRPTARYWHSLNLDWTRVSQYSPTQSGHVALMFGGKRDEGLYSGELWELWLFTDGTMGWKKRTWGGAPSARALHSAAYFSARNFPGSEQLYIQGGEQSGSGDAVTYMLEPRAQSPSWQPWASSETPLAGHAAGFDEDNVDSRVGEVYDPIGGQWFTDTGATLHQPTYPPSFIVPGRTVEGGRVYTLADSNLTYYLDVRPQGTASADWQKLDIPALDFPVKTGAMYLPGKIMVCGGGTGKTDTLNTSSLTNAWQRAGDMIPRQDHNLVILPGGKVLAVGGVNSVPVFRPQLWNPATGQWTDTLISNPDRLPPP